jgi:uncharacterized protein (DUF1697 family)
MPKYVAFLRGINVGGRIIKMTELKACFEKAGFKDVSTLLQTGNVSFESDKKLPELKQQIQELLTKTFNYPAKVIIISTENLKKIINANPFEGAPADYHQYVIFFEGDLAKDFAAEDLNLEDEEVKAGQGVAYWKVQKGKTLQSSRGKLLTKTKYRNFNTNRNLNTLQKIVKIALDRE